MEESLSYKKQIKRSIAVAAIISGVVATVQSILVDFINNAIGDESTDIFSQIASYLPNIILTPLTLALLFFIGKKLTDSNRKSLIFMSAIYFSKDILNCITTFSAPISQALTGFTSLSPDLINSIDYAISIIEIPLVILIADYAFTAFEGLNPRFYGKSLADSKMPLSTARSRYAGYTIIGGFVISILTALPILFITFFITENHVSANSDALITIVSLIFTSFTLTLQFLLIYYAGYKPCKSHIDAMALIACSGLANAISSIFYSLYAMIQDITLGNLPVDVTEDNLTATIASLSTTSLFSIVSLSISLILTLYMLKYFFSNTRITLFSEDE